MRVVPRALSSLASATVSLGSVFGGSSHATTTTTVTSATSTNTGFITTTNATSTATSTGVSTGYNNYVPAAGPNPLSGSTYTSTNTSTNTGTYSTACTTGGYPDIAVTILSRGIITSYGQFIETNSFTTSDTVSVKFKVENRGNCPTGAWSINVQMPAQSAADQTRTINGGSYLPAGSAVTGQANFTSPRSGSSSVVITATDTSGRDANNANNTASSALVVTGTGTTNPGTGTIGGYPVSGDGRPDLTVRVVSVGTLDYNNNFVPVSNQNFRTGSRVAVKFQVINQGLSASGAWTFKAEVNDMYQPRVYQNPQTESSIASGGSATYTVAFDNLGIGSHTMSLYADSYDQVNEYNEGNNTLGVNFYINY